MRELRENRSIIKFIIFGILTFGIYEFWTIHTLAKDVNTICTLQKQKTTGLAKYIIFSLLTLGIYRVFWWYRISDMLNRQVLKRGLNCKVSPGMVLASFVLGYFVMGICTFVGIHQVLEATNELSNDYNNDPTPYTVPDVEPKKKSYGYSRWGE